MNRSVVDRIPALQWKNNVSKLCSKFIVNYYTGLFVNHVCQQCSKNKHLFVGGVPVFEKDKYLSASLTNLITCMDLKILRKFLKTFMQVGFS